MTKKLICFPFIDGDLQEWSWNNLTDSERERVYNGEEVVKEYNEVWKQSLRFTTKATVVAEVLLHFIG